MVELEKVFRMDSFCNEKEENQFQSIPINCTPLTHQVAGHFYGKGRTKLGFLQTENGLVLKPVQGFPRGEREHNFFKRIFKSDQSDLNNDEKELKLLLPNYRGAMTYEEITYIKMDDLAYGIKYPAIIDFKIGKITYDPEATVEKINRQKKKYPEVEKLGFQLLGMRVFNSEDKTFRHYDKKFGRSLSEDNLKHGLALFYQLNHPDPCRTAQLNAINKSIKAFEPIQEWFSKQTTYHFYSSSVILVYDAELNDNNSVRIKIADFAHVFPAENRIDENYLYGLNNLVEHLKVLLQPEYTFNDVRNN